MMTEAGEGATVAALKAGLDVARARDAEARRAAEADAQQELDAFRAPLLLRLRAAIDALQREQAEHAELVMQMAALWCTRAEKGLARTRRADLFYNRRWAQLGEQFSPALTGIGGAIGQAERMVRSLEEVTIDVWREHRAHIQHSSTWLANVSEDHVHAARHAWTEVGALAAASEQAWAEFLASDAGAVYLAAERSADPRRPVAVDVLEAERTLAPSRSEFNPLETA